MMKTLSLIPFVIGLIGYDICVEDSPELWSNGPEYTYRLKINSSLTYVSTKRHPIVSKKESCFNTTIIVTCRPFSTSSSSQEITNALQCHIKNVESHNFFIDNSLQPAKLNSDIVLSTLKMKNKIFEIIYEENGVKELRIDPSSVEAEALIIRTIAHHLNLDATDFNKNEDSFTIHKQENSMIGQCQTQIDISTKIKFKSEQWSSKCGDKIHLETLTYGDKYPLIVINRTRDTAQCSDAIAHLIGNNEPNYNITKLSSFTEFIVAPLSFGSLTFTQGFVSVPQLPDKISTKEFIDLRLTNIEPADGPLQPITGHDKNTMKLIKL